MTDLYVTTISVTLGVSLFRQTGRGPVSVQVMLSVLVFSVLFSWQDISCPYYMVSSGICQGSRWGKRWDTSGSLDIYSKGSLGLWPIFTGSLLCTDTDVWPVTFPFRKCILICLWTKCVDRWYPNVLHPVNGSLLIFWLKFLSLLITNDLRSGTFQITSLP